ncbi:MAG: hypothetical protein MJ025_02460 [Victivallaceae bacterium]|nr:hypothetical protein [Victivallaceae bacterium]
MDNQTPRHPRRLRVGGYAHTGGFARLKGSSTAPGSEKPRSYYTRWRIIFTVLAVLFLLAGLFESVLL